MLHPDIFFKATVSNDVKPDVVKDDVKPDKVNDDIKLIFVEIYFDQHFRNEQMFAHMLEWVPWRPVNWSLTYNRKV